MGCSAQKLSSLYPTAYTAIPTDLTVYYLVVNFIEGMEINQSIE